MNRFYFSFSLAAACLTALIALNGCKAPTVSYQISQFASLRVMNFSPYGPNCLPTAPIDIYWSPTGQTRDSSQANIQNLLYGQASVYSNLLQASSYNIAVTPTRQPHSTDVATTVNLVGNQKYTLVITLPKPGQFQGTLVQDGVPNPSQNLTYIRFMNLQPNAGPLTVHVNDPVTGDLINPVADTFGQVSPYVPLQTAQDTSYAFFVTNSANKVITRLAYQTFAGGNCYTLVFAYDSCETFKVISPAANPGDSTQSADDTIRLRAFDDNSSGSDLTIPIASSFRYNIVNDIIPTSNPYDASHPNDSTLGFLVSGVGFQEYHGYSIPPIPVYQGGGENFQSKDSTFLDVNYQSALVPIASTPLNIQGFATDAAGSFQQQLFNAGSTSYLLNDNSFYPIGNLPANNNKPWTLLFFDTVPSTAGILNTEMPTHFSLIQVPDTSSADEVTILFIGGIPLGPKPNNLAAANSSLFYVQNSSGVFSPPGNSTGIAPGLSKILQIPLAAGSSAMFTVTDSIGNKTGPTRVFGNTASFTAQAGGIYEIVSVGLKTDPHLLIMHVNQP